MAKTKAQRKAIRKEGMAEFKQGVKQSLKGRAQITSAGLKAAGNVISSMKKGNRIGGAAGAVLSEVGDAVRTPAGKSGIANMTKGDFHIAKGLLKGIFNDPSWRNAYGFDPMLVVNKDRPFTPKALKQLSNNAFDLGVGHIIDTNFKWPDWSQDESFILAVTEAFREIRLDLKSNLNYNLEDYKCYLLNSISIMIMSAQLERNIGWTKYINATIPSLYTLMRKYINENNQAGINIVSDIQYLDEEHYATTLTRQKILSTIISQLRIPARLQDFIHWIAGTVFFDQGAPNMQIYRTWISDIPVYKIVNGVCTKVASFGTADYNVDTLISFVTEILQIYGIMNADITKTGTYATMNHIEYESYTPRPLCDFEYFNMLVNAWTKDAAYAAKHNGFFRVDLMQELNDKQNPGISYGLGGIVPVSLSTPIQVVNQGLILEADSQMLAPIGINTLSYNATTTYSSSDSIWKLSGTNNLLGLVITSRVTREVVFKSEVANVATSDSFQWKPGSMLQGSISSTSGTFNLTDSISFEWLPNVQGYQTIDLVTSLENKYKIVFRYSPASAELGTVNPSGTYTKAVDLDLGTDYQTTDLKLNPDGSKYVVSVKFLNKIQTTTVSTCLSAMVNLFTTRTLIAVNAFESVNLMYMRSAVKSNTIKMDRAHIVEYFIENVDYHIPVLYSESYQVYVTSSGTNSNVINVTTPTRILKECYVPVIYNETEAQTLLYQIYASLLRITQ